MGSARGRGLFLTVLAMALAIGLAPSCGGEAPVPPTTPSPPTTTPTWALPQGYTTSRTCRMCHSAQYEAWTKSLHSRMLHDPAADPAAILGDFEGSSPARSFTKSDVVYTLGSRWKQQYLTEVGDDYYLLPAEWVVATGEWQPYHPEDWQERPWFQECAACHVTGLDLENKSFAEASVGCEACHGPGRLHATTGDKTKIVNPANLSFELQGALCGRCHIRGQDASGVAYPVGFEIGQPLPESFTPVSADDPSYFWPDGSSKMNYQQYLDWQQSKHYQSGQAGCTSCHEAHGTSHVADIRSPEDDLCTGCHTDHADVAAHTPYMEAFPRSCVSCHMPRLATSAVPYDMSIHTFSTPDLHKTFEWGMPNACNLCHDQEIGDIPIIPHTLYERSNCLMCHKSAVPMPEDHQGRTSEYCVSCHKPSVL